MSIKAMAAVWDLDTDPTLKLLLLALADFADARGICWPAYPTLAARVGVSERQVARLILAAEDAGYLLRDRGGGRGRPTHYRLTVKVTPASRLESGETVTPVAETVTPVTGNGDTGVTLTVTEPSIEPRTSRARGKIETSEALRKARTSIDPGIFGANRKSVSGIRH